MPTRFSRDDLTRAVDRNGRLAKLLEGAWMGLKIVKIERIKKQATPKRNPGWKVTFD